MQRRPPLARTWWPPTHRLPPLTRCAHAAITKYPGKHPFGHVKLYMSLQAAVCSQPSPTPPAGTPPEVIDFVAGCLVKEAAVSRSGRLPVHMLLNGAWLKPHSQGIPQLMTVEYLRQIGLIAKHNSTEPSTAQELELPAPPMTTEPTEPPVPLAPSEPQIPRPEPPVPPVSALPPAVPSIEKVS